MSIASVRAASPFFPRQTPLPPTPSTEQLHALSLEPEHHGEYYLEDGVIFLVENTLFKIPRYLLVRESAVFADMFSMPAGFSPSEGKTDAAPIQLLQVKSRDFERLLAVVYPLRFNKMAVTTEEDWTSVLHLATRWQMSEVRMLSIARLTACASAVSKVILGRLYDHPPWIRDGFCDLCLRNEPLQLDEAKRLNVEDILGIASGREKIRANVLSSRCERRWSSTKYGECLTSSTYYAHGELYATNMMVHAVLDKVFDLGDTAVVEDASQSPPYCSTRTPSPY